MKRFLTSCFGLGRLPVAPGTAGSVAPAVIFAVLGGLDLSAIVIAAVCAAMAVFGSVVCVCFSPAVIEAVGKKDPGEIVADEFAGQAVTFLILSAITAGQVAAVTVSGFLLFRFFDILKPWPIRKLEKFPGGWGILADDLLAGVYAGVLVLLCHQLGWISALDGFISNLFS